MLDRDSLNEVIEEFNSLVSGARNEISFSKGYKIYEEVYNEFLKDFELKREEIKETGHIEVIITRGWKMFWEK